MAHKQYPVKGKFKASQSCPLTHIILFSCFIKYSLVFRSGSLELGRDNNF